MSNHVGTHVDAPYHFIQEGLTIDQYRMEEWFLKHWPGVGDEKTGLVLIAVQPTTTLLSLASALFGTKL